MNPYSFCRDFYQGSTLTRMEQRTDRKPWCSSGLSADQVCFFLFDELIQDVKDKYNQENSQKNRSPY